MTHDLRPTQDQAMCQRSRQTNWLNAPWSEGPSMLTRPPPAMEGGYSPMNGRSLQGLLAVRPAQRCMPGGPGKNKYLPFS
jgi:hypothetical protein